MSAAGGNRRELRAQRLLEGAGYLVHRAVRSSRPGRAQAGYLVNGAVRNARPGRALGNDVWGVFDLLGTMAGRRLLFVQVTTVGAASARKRKIERVASYFDPQHTQLEVWGWEVVRGRGRWRVWRWTGSWARAEVPNEAVSYDQ